MTMTSKEEKNQLKKHANRNISYILKELGISCHRRDSLIQGKCPSVHHPGDRSNTTAFSWRTDIARWVCWSHHCEEKSGNDVFALVRSVKDCGFKEAVDFIAKTLKKEDVNVEEEIIEEVEEKRARGKVFLHESISESNLKHLSADLLYLINRGFDEKVLRRYGVGLWSRPGTFMQDRVVFPIRDHQGYLVGYTGRTVHTKQWFEDKSIEFYKWIHGRSYHRFPSSKDSLKTGSVLYNLHNAVEHFSISRKLILVEGPLDGMRLEEAGIHNWAAVFGTNFCHSQRSLLVSKGVTDLYIAFDNDENNAGNAGFKKVQKVVGNLFNINRIDLPLGCDCGDLSAKQLRVICDEAGATIC